MRVSLVGTVHAESGLASVVELQAILDRSKPDVIFAEIPAANVDRYTDCSHGNLESIAVARYLASHHVELVPVDLAKPAQKFFDDAEHMFRVVERTSPDYRRMIDRHRVETRMGGFLYLNSDRCVQLWAGIYREVVATIDLIGDRRLREIYDLWNHTNERRDREMLQKIVRYSACSPVARGVFLIGAAHRKSIMDKALSGSGTALPRIDWDLDGFLEVAG